jgi:hypothetical protein
MYTKGQGVPQGYVLAHMWISLAALESEGTTRNEALKNMDHVASIMTPAQVAEAQNLAREWKPKKEKP